MDRDSDWHASTCQCPECMGFCADKVRADRRAPTREDILKNLLREFLVLDRYDASSSGRTDFYWCRSCKAQRDYMGNCDNLESCLYRRTREALENT